VLIRCAASCSIAGERFGPAADAAFVMPYAPICGRDWVEELDANINDPQFADCAAALFWMLRQMPIENPRSHTKGHETIITYASSWFFVSWIIIDRYLE
jgi:hypothetical protein